MKSLSPEVWQRCIVHFHLLSAGPHCYYIFLEIMTSAEDKAHVTGRSGKG